MAENFIRVKQINQTDLSGFVAQVVQDTGVLGNTFVTTTSNQNISGIKTFLNNLNVSGDLTIAGTLRYNEIIDTTVTGNISGYTGIFTTIFANNLVYNTGNQSIFGVKTFHNGIDVGELDNGIVGIYDSAQGSYINIFPSDGTLTFQLENNNQSLAFDLSSLGNNETAIIATDSQVVHKAGNETISGTKTFNTGIVLASSQSNTPTGLPEAKGLQWLGLGGSNYDQTIYAAYDGFQKIGINFRSGPTNLQDTIIFRPSKIEAFRPIEVSGNINVSGSGIFNALNLNNIDNLNLSGVDVTITNSNVGIGTLSPTERVHISGGNLKVDGHVNISGFIFDEAHYSRNPLGFYSDAGIKTGRINILTGIAPFSRLVYSGNLGVLNNPNETMVIFSTTGFAPRPLLSRFIASRNLAISSQSPTVGLGTHNQFMFNSSTTITNNCGIDFSPFGGSFAIGGGSTTNRYGAFSLIDPTKFSNDFLYVTKDYTQAYNTKAIAGTFGEYIVSGNTFVNISLTTATYKTGITYAQNAAQYLTGFLVGFYSAQGGNLNCNPFNACGAAGVNGTSTGCHIVFESAWLTTDAQNNSWLNMAFRNHGPSGMRFATSQGFPNGANPTGIVLDMFAFDY